MHLVGAKRGAEIRFKDLDAAGQRDCREAMAKEWAKWEQFGATRPVSMAEWKQAQDAKVAVIGARWVNYCS